MSPPTERFVDTIPEYIPTGRVEVS
jgi:hypothetical protein